MSPDHTPAPTSDINVLFVDDEADLREAAAQSLMLADIVTDIRMPGMDGLTLMARALEIDPELPVILVTGHGDVDLAVQAMRDGAYDFLEKPYAPARLIERVRRALDKRRLTLENRLLKREMVGQDPIAARLTGRSQAITQVRQRLRAVAESQADVLIHGPTGAGKEVAARALHRASSRAGGPFVQINCAALPAHLIESELFGHEAGAFPGAQRARYGKFEHARGGIVCLDEIDSLAPDLQAKLLSALEHRQITRLGSNDPVALDIRVIATAKSDLERAVAQGSFRADLLYRLNVVTLEMPGLAARAEDIPALFSTLLSEACHRYSRPQPPLPGALLSALSARAWPGNVRELRNAAERYAMGLDLDLGPGVSEPQTLSLPDAMARHEKALIAAGLQAHGGSLKATYAALGISRKALYEKMQKYGLAKAEFAAEDER